MKLALYVLATVTTLSVSAIALAQYQAQVKYLDSLRAPSRPTLSQCQALSAAFLRASQQIDAAHERCLAGSGAEPRGRTCDKASCQALHDLRERAKKRSASENQRCRQNLGIAESEERRLNEEARIMQEHMDRRNEEVNRQLRQQSGQVMQPAPNSGTRPSVGAPRISQPEVQNIQNAREFFDANCNAYLLGSSSSAAGCDALKKWLDVNEPRRDAAVASGNRAYDGPTVRAETSRDSRVQIPQDPRERDRNRESWEQYRQIIARGFDYAIKKEIEPDYERGGPGYEVGCTLARTAGLNVCAERDVNVDYDQVSRDARAQAFLEMQQNLLRQCAEFKNPEIRRKIAREEPYKFLQLETACPK